ncbi:MAG TPA: hypothetical protein VFE47_05945 [Tepidisphaeraceae bacterium]|jgi:hypothetical protein|nr:hypothetical protein [Tepidisphaeraceae bacterium]
MGCRLRLIVALLPFVSLLASFSAASEPDPFPTGRVGIYGAPDRLILQGEKTFKPEEIRQALQTDWEVQLASAPSGLLDEYVGAIRRQLRYGYLAAGFADVTVSAGADAEHETVVATIEEGARYKCGPIHINGTKAFSADALIARLTHDRTFPTIIATHDPDGTLHYAMNVTKYQASPLWKSGEFADLSPAHEHLIREKIEGFLSDAGYFSPAFKSTTRTRDGVVSLEIEFSAEGPRAALGKFTLLGLKPQRTQEVMKFLDFHADQPIGLEKIVDAQLKLWRSGRFKRHVMTVRPINEQGRLDVTLDLEELPGVPALDQPLGREEQALLKFREWLLSRSAAGEDIIAKSTTPDGSLIEGIIGPDGGMIRVRTPSSVKAASRAASGPATAPAHGMPMPSFPPSLDLEMIMSADKVGIYNLQAGRMMVTNARPTLAFNVIASVMTEVEPNNQTKWSFNVNAGMQSQSDHPGLNVELDLAPAAFVDMAHRSDAHCSIAGDVLAVDGETGTYRIEMSTGQLISGRMKLREGEIELSARANALKEEIAARQDAKAENSFDSSQPVTSFLVFLVDEAARIAFVDANRSPDGKRAAEVLFKLLSPRVLEPLKRVRILDGTDSDFSIPHDPRLRDGENPLGKLIMTFALPACDQLFDRGNWPWVLAREQLLIYAGRTENLGPELDRVLASNKIGPVGKLMTSALVSEINMQGSTDVAGSGLRDLNIAAFDKDVAVLTQGDSISAEVMRRFADELRHLSKDDTEVLANVLTPESAKIFRDFTAALRAHPDEPIDKALPDALDQIWPDIIHAALQAALQAKVPGA